MQKFWQHVVGAAVLVAAFSMPAQAAFQLQSWIGIDGPPESRRCAQPTGGMSAWNGSVLELVPCEPYDSSSLWEEEKVSDETRRGTLYWTVRFRNVGRPELCLDLRDGNTANGTPLQLWECDDKSTSMQWVVTTDSDDKRIWPRRSWDAHWKRCFILWPCAPGILTSMDVPFMSSVPLILNYEYWGTLSQAWRYVVR